MFKVIVFFLSLALRAWAQTTTAGWVDSNTGITFDYFLDSTSKYFFGIALPETVGTDFIGQIIAPMTDGAGWAGIDLGATMANHLLVVAWPYNNEIVSSFRVATGYTTPPVYTTSNMTLLPIANGTFVNSTHMSYTFLCKGCIDGTSNTFASSATSNVFGWAFASTAVTTPSDSSSALSYHGAGFGEFGVTISDAQSANYATWAAMASSSTSTGSNSTTTTTAPQNITTTVSNTTYDYIVAGAGPAGLIVAERLAETGKSVLLLERGKASLASTGGTAYVAWNDSVTQYDVPAMAYYLATASDTSEYCTDTASQAGCILGGGTMVNALMYVKPQSRDFDDKWPAGWKSADVSSAESRLYSRNPGTILASADGKRYDQGAYDVLSTFFNSSGWTSVDALSQPDEKHDVYSHPPWNIASHERGGPARTYLPLAQQYPNFSLQLNSKFIRAVRNSSWISGVEVETGTNTRQIINVTPSTGKVILAGGALSTPRMLFYSGIGPASQIQVVQSALNGSVTLPPSSSWIDLPVGKNIKDHTILTVKMTTKTNMSALATTAYTAPSQTDIDLFAQGSGLLTQGGQRLNFWTSVVSPSDNGTRFIQGTCNGPSANTVSIKAYLTHGLTSSTDIELDSTGVNTVLSGSPWLQTTADNEAMEVFFQRLIDMATASTSNVELQMSDGSYVTANTTGAQLLASVKSTLVTGSHFVGSAKMGLDDGRKNNGSAVVDTNTQVYGTDNLFVVDASFHPDLPTGNTQAIVMVAAEQAAAKILALDGLSISGGNATSLATSGTGTSSAATATATDSDDECEPEPVTSSAASSTALSIPTASIIASKREAWVVPAVDNEPYTPVEVDYSSATKRMSLAERRSAAMVGSY